MVLLPQEGDGFAPARGGAVESGARGEPVRQCGGADPIVRDRVGCAVRLSPASAADRIPGSFARAGSFAVAPTPGESNW